MQTYFEMPTKDAMHICWQSSVTNLYARDARQPTARYKRSRDALDMLCNEAGIDCGSFRKQVLKSLDRAYLSIEENDEAGISRVMVPLV